MNPVVIANFTPPAKIAGPASHGGHTAESGFRDALREHGGGKHGTMPGPHAANRALADRLANRGDDLARHRQSLMRTDGDQTRIDGDAQTDDVESGAAPDKASAEDEADDESASTASGVPAPMRNSPDATHRETAGDEGHAAHDDTPGGKVDVAVGRTIDARRLEKLASPDLKGATHEAAAPHEADAPQPPPADGAPTGPHADGPPPAAVNETGADRTSRFDASTEIAALLGANHGNRRDATSTNRIREFVPSPTTTPGAAEREGPVADVRLASDTQPANTGGAVGLQRMPFGSSVAMLNLMTRGATPAEAKVAEPAAAGRTLKPAIDVEDTPGADPQPLEVVSADSLDSVGGGTSAARSGTRSDDGDTGGEARERSANGGLDGAQPAADKSSARVGEPPVQPPRLGPTATSVVQTLASAPALEAARAPTQQLSNPETVSAATHSLKIQLRPVELGEITATLRMNGDALTVEMTTETSEAYDRLNVDSDAIVKALRGLGLQVDQITIQPPQVASTATRSDGAQPNQTAGGGNQQSTQAGNSGGGSEGQRGTASHGEQRNGGQTRQPASSGDENRLGRGLVI